jgi:hypothetical protein
MDEAEAVDLDAYPTPASKLLAQAAVGSFALQLLFIVIIVWR